MGKTLLTIITIILFSKMTIAQKSKDSIIELPSIIITAYEQNKKITEVPAAIGFISNKQLQNFQNTSILPAINNLPGLRMEERSPGSYRMNIRGSSLRSPFGVRNVKVYLNNIPFTDPGGTTYLNQFSFYNIQNIEIIKGPASSLYGSGNGGVLLLKSTTTNQPQGLGMNLSFGSYGLQNYNATIRIGNYQAQNSFSFSRLKSDGYRTQTNLKRDVFTWDGTYQLSEKSKLNTIFLLGDLYYQTPGGLTEAEFNANPAQARPKVGVLPSAETAKAAIYQQTFYAGINHTYAIAKQFQNTTSFYGAFSRIQNPSIRNYERRTEPHIGLRSTFAFTPIIPTGKLKIVAGTELQNGMYTTKVYKTKNGISDSLQTEDELNPKNLSIFTQIDYDIKNWIFSTGASINQNKISIHRLSTFPLTEKTRTYKNELSPRVAVLKKWKESFSIFASISNGFSSPTVAEVLPSTSVISLTLNAENGWNYETGAKWQPRNNLSFDVNLFYFKLNNTIVLRRDLSGADYFENAGSTNQKGMEFSIKYQLKTPPNSFVNRPILWANYTYHDFKYQSFKQVTADFSGNKLPGVPQQTINAGFDVHFAKSFYTNTTFNYVSAISLNDANTFKAAEYYLLAMRLGFKKKVLSKYLVDFFIGGDNLFNETYSLGNDINAAGNRFYNAAPKRNFSVGFNFFMDCKGKE
jgi:iron complex outermembrane recepter protein